MKYTMIYRLDYFMNGKWTTWGFYEDADEAQDDAFEHQRVYGSEDVRIVPVPNYILRISQTMPKMST